MIIGNIPIGVTDWSKVHAAEHPDDLGHGLGRTCQFNDIRERMVEYSPSCIADHWCKNGHILLV